jgi:hypothetical protein
VKITVCWQRMRRTWLAPWCRSIVGNKVWGSQEAAVPVRVLLSRGITTHPYAWGSKISRLMRWEEVSRQANSD